MSGNAGCLAALFAEHLFKPASQLRSSGIERDDLPPLVDQNRRRNAHNAVVDGQRHVPTGAALFLTDEHRPTNLFLPQEFLERIGVSVEAHADDLEAAA